MHLMLVCVLFVIIVWIEMISFFLFPPLAHARTYTHTHTHTHTHTAVHSNRKSSEQEDDNEDELGVMQELSCVQRVSEEDQAWAVKRIGSSGQVVLLRAAQRGGAGKIAVSLLSRKFSLFFFSLSVNVF